MRIEKVEIKNFRSIIEGSFNIDSILAIVGQNNAGKSNVIAALDSFFHPDNQIGDYLNGKNKCGLQKRTPSIIVSFGDATNSEFSSYIDSDNIVTIKQEFKNNKLSYQIFNPALAKYEPYNGKINDFIDFILIPINRLNEIENSTLIKDSIVYKAIEESLRKLSEKRDTFSAQLMKAYDYIDKHAFEKIAKEINKYLMATDVQAIIKKAVDIDSTLLMQILGISITEKGKEFPINYCGSGIQSLFVIGIYQYLSDQLGINYVVAIEEPEVNLHPQAQRQFINSIKESTKGNKNQVILSTHSPYIIDQLGHINLLLIKKKDHPKRGFVTELTQIRKTFFSDYGLQEAGYYKFAGFKNSDVFFSSYVIITESPTDANVVKLLGEKANIDISNTSISLLSLGGVDNLKYVLALLKELDIPHCWILDKDFFLDYKNGNEADKSRDSNGYYQYTTVWTSNAERMKLIEALIPNVSDRNKLLPLLSKNHIKALELFDKYNIICMRYNLEMDMCSSKQSQTFLYNVLNIPVGQQTIKTLLIKCKKSIKNAIIIHKTLNVLNNRNLPYSYKAIINMLKKQV